MAVLQIRPSTSTSSAASRALSAATLAHKRLPSAERIWRGVAARAPSREPNVSTANGVSARRSAASTPAAKSTRQGAASSRACAGRGVWWGAAARGVERCGRGARRSGRVVVFVSFCSVETCLAEWPVAPFARAQHPEDDDHGVVAAPASRVAPVAGVRVVEGVAAADAAVLGPGGLELHPRAGVRADRQEPARPRVQRRTSWANIFVSLTA